MASRERSIQALYQELEMVRKRGFRFYRRHSFTASYSEKPKPQNLVCVAVWDFSLAELRRSRVAEKLVDSFFSDKLFSVQESLHRVGRRTDSETDRRPDGSGRRRRIAPPDASRVQRAQQNGDGSMPLLSSLAHCRG